MHVIWEFSYNRRMRMMWRTPILGWFVIAALCLPVSAQDAATAPGYRADPSLAAESPPPPVTDPADRHNLLVIETDEREASMRMQTAVPVVPYLGAELAPEMSPEERRLLQDSGARDGLGDYKLEAGIGLYVEDRASLNLGYRFQHPPSLLDDRRNDPLTLTGDLRITFDVKIPFD